MLTTLRQGVVITQVWTCLMVFVLLSAGGTGDSDLKDTLAFVWLAGALACALGIPCRLYLAKRKWIQIVGDERGASFIDSVVKLCKGERFCQPCFAMCTSLTLIASQMTTQMLWASC